MKRSVSIGFALLVAACSQDGTGGGGGAGGNAGGAGGSADAPWTPGCGDAISCSFFFDNLAGVDACFESCAAEIAACGVDGADCDEALRCGDDLIAEDYASGCFTDASVTTWFCYHDRFDCMVLRSKQLAARELLACILPCMPSSNCNSFPPACSAVPPEPPCWTCLETNCLGGAQCSADCRNTQVPCIESCRMGACDGSEAACIGQCSPTGMPTQELVDVYTCMQAQCAAECCA